MTVLSMVACVGLGFLFFSSGGQDDTYITYFVAQALADHGVLVNYNGLRLEQSSTLSLVILLAGLAKTLPIPLPLIGYLVSMGSAAAAVGLAAHAGARMGMKQPQLVGPIIATVACFGFMATSGTEMVLVPALALWAVLESNHVGTHRRVWPHMRAFVAFLTFAAVRPESTIVLASMVAGLLTAWLTNWLWSRRADTPSDFRAANVLAVLGLAAVAALSVFGFRKLYFGMWFPNPAYMKEGGFALDEGLLYLWDNFVAQGMQLLALFVVGLVFIGGQLVRGRLRNTATPMVAAACFAQLSFAAISGGDWMSGARFLVPAVPLLTLMGMYVFDSFATSVRGTAAAAVVLTVANAFNYLQFVHVGKGEGRPAWTSAEAIKLFRQRTNDNRFSAVELLNKQHLRDALTIHKLMPIVDRAVQIRKEPVWIVTGQAGMTPYYVFSKHYGEVKLLDLWSLTTRELFDCTPPALMPKSKWGTFHDVDRIFARRKELAACGIPMPDIFVNECLSGQLRRWLQKNNYELVFNQVGWVKNVESKTYDKYIPSHMRACGFIAVKKKLADELGLRASRDWKWDLNPRPNNGTPDN